MTQLEQKFNCSVCKQDKTIDSFYLKKNNKASSWCKSCYAEYYKINKQIISDAQKDYRKTKSCLLARLKRHLNNWENMSFYSQRRRAVKTVRIALACGEISRSDICEICGARTLFIDAHHHDYTKPLDVSWMCRKCHKMTHKKLISKTTQTY
jgi:hypothetical protein